VTTKYHGCYNIMMRTLYSSLFYVAAIVGASVPIARWQSSRDGDRLKQLPIINFVAPSPAPPNSSILLINASILHQTIWGFGGGITESAVTVFNKLDPISQKTLLDDLYGDNTYGTSLRYTGGRLTIGSCDYSLNYYNYDDTANDSSLQNFSITHDEAEIIPFIRRAQETAAATGRELRFVSTPWSPPGWMKTNGRMSCFPLGPLDCALLPQFESAWALYLSKYLTAYESAGVNVWAITVQVSRL
jgi:glucosylceramidase